MYHFLTIAQASSSDFGFIGMLFGLVGMLIGLTVAAVMIASMWKLFTKAGKPGWAAIIPIYNIVVMLEIIGRPIWWIVLFFIPVVNFVVGVVISIEFAKAYGKDIVWGLGMAFLGIIFMPLLAFSNSRYQGPDPLF